MKTRSLLLASAASISMLAVTQSHAVVAENSLAGVKLYDAGSRIIKLFGNPDLFQRVNVPSVQQLSGRAAQAAPGMSPGGGFGGPGHSGFSDQRGITPSGNLFGSPFQPSMPLDVRQFPSVPSVPSTPGLPAVTSGGIPEMDVIPTPAGINNVFGNAEAAGFGTGSAIPVEFVAWVYKRPSAQYKFILDPYMKVVQIEVLGIGDKKIRTKKGVGFGSTFSDLISKYQKPDSYELIGSGLLVKYLHRFNVAFRLEKIGANKPHQVVGIVVTAGRRR